MKIFLITPTLAKGGAERVVSTLSKGFSELGHEVIVIVFSPPLLYPTYGKLINYRVSSSKNKRIKIFRIVKTLFNFAKCIYFLKRDFKIYNPDVIFSFMEDANFCAILTGANLCVSVHTNLSYISPWARVVSKILYKKANKVISVSTGQTNDIGARYQLKNLCLIHNPIDLNELSKLKNAKIDFEGEFILAVGRLSKVKNFPLLLEAYSAVIKVEKTAPNLLIIGGGELRDFLQSYVKKLNIEDRVFFWGNIENPFAYMSKCRFFVLSSLSESFGNVLVEAMACGALCIATDCPDGPRDIIKNGTNGFLIKNNDVQSLIEKMLFCLSPEHDFSLIKKAAISSTDRFALKSICLEYLAASM